jgi:hypothetical protein
MNATIRKLGLTAILAATAPAMTVCSTTADSRGHGIRSVHSRRPHFA